MVTIQETEHFANWFQTLGDEQARARIRVRDFKQAGHKIVILFCGGDKPTQDADIAFAKKLAKMPVEVKEWKP
jgi:putative component of toxin-antitoxin plasmid stabilization module